MVCMKKKLLPHLGRIRISSVLYILKSITLLFSCPFMMPTSSKTTHYSEICSRNFVPRVIVWRRAHQALKLPHLNLDAVVLKHKEGVVNNWRSSSRHLILKAYIQPLLGHEIRISTAAHWTEMKPWKDCFWETKNRAHTLLSCKIRRQFDFLFATCIKNACVVQFLIRISMKKTPPLTISSQQDTIPFFTTGLFWTVHLRYF